MVREQVIYPSGLAPGKPPHTDVVWEPALLHTTIRGNIMTKDIAVRVQGDKEAVPLPLLARIPEQD